MARDAKKADPRKAGSSAPVKASAPPLIVSYPGPIADTLIEGEAEAARSAGSEAGPAAGYEAGDKLGEGSEALDQKTQVLQAQADVASPDYVKTIVSSVPTGTVEEQSRITDATEIEDFQGRIIAEHYQLTGKLGSGGCGTVFKARHLFLNKFVAIKLLPPQYQADPRFVQRFEREAQAASRLDHPNLVRVLEFGIQDATPYLVMELVEGTTLSTLLSARGRINTLQATEIGLQISAGLAHAHKKGIIHRDIKPSNIIITRDNDGNEMAKVVDFGIAKVVSGTDQINQTLTVTGEIIGTPLFMSPEQCVGEELDERSDIYSLGCVLYQMVAGRPAVTAENALGAMMAHANEVRPDFSEVPVAPYYRSIIEKCLKRDPAKRFSDMTQLYKALARSSKEDLVAMLGKLDLTLEDHRVIRMLKRWEPSAVAWCNGWLVGWVTGMLLVAAVAYALLLLPVLNNPYLNGDWHSSMKSAEYSVNRGAFGAAQHFYDQAELAALKEKNNQHLVEALKAKAELFKAHPIPPGAAKRQILDDVHKSVLQGIDQLTPR